MKILHVISSLNTGGAEKLVSEIVPRLIKLGNTVDVFTFDGSRTKFRSTLEEAGVRVLSYKEGCNVYNPLIILKLCQLIGRYDVVHTHNTSPQFFTAVAGAFSRVKLVTTEHSTDNRRRTCKPLRLVDRAMYTRYRKVICISDQTHERLGDYLPVLNEKLVTIHNGINLRNYAEAEELSAEERETSKFVVTMVAAFRYQKDHETAIKAMSHLDKDLYELWLVGDGDRRDDILKTIQKYGLSDNVRLWGVRDDVPAIIKSSDVIIQISHIEGFGLAAVEGMAAGKPVIATDIPGLAQVVGDAGMLVPHQDDVSLAKSIELLRNDPRKYREIAHGCELNARRFDIDDMAWKYNELYRSL